MSTEDQPLLSSLADSDHTYSSTQYGVAEDARAADDDLMKEALYPEDAYEGSVYWADLPRSEQRSWNRAQYNKEAYRELRSIKDMLHKRWYTPLTYYLSEYAVAGTGFFSEGFVLFSIGNIMPLFKSQYPRCFRLYNVCDKQVIQAIKYMEITGIVFGQGIVGYIGDKVGRRYGLIQDAAIMLFGTILLTAMWGATLSDWTVMYVVAVFVFGFGVGGEYPMTSTTSMEKFHGRRDRMHRGRSVLLAFLMQGWGQLVNQVALIVLMLISNRTIHRPYTEWATQFTFRTSFAIAGFSLVYFLYLRVYKSNISQDTSNNDRNWPTTKHFLKHYWHRILASAVCWFCSDFAFYGNQVFRNQLLELVTGTAPEEVSVLWSYNLINIGCELTGYYLAALMIDHKNYGRKTMQLVGFAAMFILFGGAAIGFPWLNQKGTGAKIFQTIFYLTNFFVQFGPNSTTFLTAGECFPKSFRSTAHGFGAAIGKAGALTATVSYNYLDDRSKFYTASAFTFAGFVTTVLFLADTTGLDLEEQQRYWKTIKEGKEQDYHGIAIHPRHLSLYERIWLKRDGKYDLGRDRAQRVAELRQEVKSRSNSDSQETLAEDEPRVQRNVRKFFEQENS